MQRKKTDILTICCLQHTVILTERGILLYEIIFYDTTDGKCPVQDFSDSLEPKFLAKTLRTIDLLETNGPLLREPYSKPLENGIIKKTAKTPKSAIDLAKKYKTDYEWRHRNEQL